MGVSNLDNILLNNFYNGNCFNAYELWGAHIVEENCKKGVRFSVCAPNASHIQIIGEFN